MAYFSAFWLKHYKDLRNCCMTEPISGYYGSVIMSSLFDIDWMNSKKLKWIFMDKHGYSTSWVDARGMIHNVPDLKRSPEGIEIEKRTGNKIKDIKSFNSADTQYLHALWLRVIDEQKNCALCPQHGGGSLSDAPPPPPSSGGGGGEEEDKSIINESSWKQFADGNIPDFGGKYAVFPPVADYTPTIYVDHIIGAQYGGAAGAPQNGGGNQNVQIDPLIPAALQPMPIPPVIPTNIPPKAIPSLPGKPTLSRPGRKNTTGAGHKSVTDTQIIGIKPTPPPVGQSPAAVGTYGVVPTYSNEPTSPPKPQPNPMPTKPKKQGTQKGGAIVSGKNPSDERPPRLERGSKSLFSVNFDAIDSIFKYILLGRPIQISKPAQGFTGQKIAEFVDKVKGFKDDKSSTDKDKEQRDWEETQKRLANENRELNKNRIPFYQITKEGVYINSESKPYDTSGTQKIIVDSMRKLGFSEKRIQEFLKHYKK